jgi:hypothetical protein
MAPRSLLVVVLKVTGHLPATLTVDTTVRH